MSNSNRPSKFGDPSANPKRPPFAPSLHVARKEAGADNARRLTRKGIHGHPGRVLRTAFDIVLAVGTVSPSRQVDDDLDEDFDNL